MKHILFDLNDCPSDLLDNEDFVRFSFAASTDNIAQALENIKKMLG